MTTAIHKGDRVAIAAHSDIFMMGERFGEVISIGRKWIHVKGERSGRTFKFWKGGDSLETLAPTVTLNEERRLFVIRCGEGFTCLGFDVCHERATRYGAWLLERAPSDYWAICPHGVEAPGTLASYQQYQAITSAIHARYNATRERCEVDLCPQLVPYDGRRVEVVDSYGETRRFTVGKSSGWIPVHLELEPRANGGSPVYGAPFKSVRAI